MKILLETEKILFFISAFFCLYQIVMCFFNFAKEKSKDKKINKEHRFMAVIPARNEENVIRYLIESLKNQNYPEHLLDIYVIADNCTDCTAYLAEKAGAKVLQRFDNEKKSKGYALEWFFEYILQEKPDKYDAFCVFDADNLVSKDFFKIMNQKLCEGEKIVQGYRDIKNAEDNWITGNYAIFYWMMNRFYHYTRYKIGLSPLINGTGFMVAMSVIKESNGWHTETLTEDIEFSLNSIAKGYRIGWAKDAIVYDEQPLEFEKSITQRMRWSVGHIQCLKTCLPNLVMSKKFTATTLDSIIYLLGMPIFWISLFIILLKLIKFIYSPKSIIYLLITTIVGIISIIIQALIVVLIENKSVKKLLKGIITYPIFLISWFFINIVATFKTKIEWKPISHVKTMDIREIN